MPNVTKSSYFCQLNRFSISWTTGAIYEIEVHILCKHNFINTVIHMLSKLSHKVQYSLGSRWMCSESELNTSRTLLVLNCISSTIFAMLITVSMVTLALYFEHYSYPNGSVISSNVLKV